MKPPPEIPPSFFEHIGRLCTTTAWLEDRLQARIWQILNIDEARGAFITRGLDLSGKWDLILELLASANIAKHSEIKARHHDLKRVIATHELATTGVLSYDTYTNRWGLAPVRGKRSGEIKNVTDEDLTGAIETAKSLGDMF